MLRAVRTLLFTLLPLWGPGGYCTCVSAQTVLSGIVYEAGTNLPLAGAYVYPQSQPGAVTTTDSAGAFTLEATPDTLIVSYLGYRTARKYVGGGGTPVSIYLTGNADASIAALTVSARKIENGELASTRIGQLDVYLNPAAKADPLLAVNQLPAATNPDETANVSLRDSPSEATGVYLNDVPIRGAVRLDQSNGVGQFSLFQALPMRDIRVYAAAPPVNFSQTSAGAVALDTDRRPPTETSHGVNLGLAGAGLSYARPLGENTGLRGYLNYGNTAAFQSVNDDGLPELRESVGLDGALQLIHNFSEKHTLQAYYLAFRERYRFDVRTPYYDGTFSQQKPRHLVVVNRERRMGDWELRMNNAFDWERGEFAFGNSATEARRWHYHGALHATHRRGGRTLKFGLARNQYDDRIAGTAPTVAYRLAATDPSVAYTGEERRHVAEAYAYWQRRVGEKWLLGGGVKPLQDLRLGDTYLSAQASVRYTVGENSNLHLTGGRFAQLLAPGQNVRTWQWLEMDQITLEYRGAAKQWRWEGAVFAKREQYSAVPDLSVLGAEAGLGYDGPIISAWASATTVRNRGVFSSTLTSRDLPILARARVQGKLGGQITVGLAATHRSGTYFFPLAGRAPLAGTDNWMAPIFATTADRLPEYARVDASASKAMVVGSGSLIVYINVNNILDTENVRAYTYDATFTDRSAEVYSRRIFFFGLTYQW